MRLTLCLAAVLAALAVAGCGDNSDSPSANGGTDTTPAHVRTIQVLHHVNRLARPPGPGAHPGAVIDHLIVRDVRRGIGPALQAGDTGVFDFIGANYLTGRALDSSWGRRRPFESKIDKGVVIDGWWQGIVGMRVGGRRQLIVPPSLGFTTSPDPELQGMTTFFDVVLIEIRPAQPAALATEERQEEGPTVATAR